jgi:hypothetical protein
LMAIQLHALTSLYFNGLHDTIESLAVRPRNGRAKEDRKESQRKVKVKGKSRSKVYRMRAGAINARVFDQIFEPSAATY